LKSLSTAVEEFATTFAPTGEATGSESAIGRTTETDPVKPDVGWDRMSSADDEDGAEPLSTDEDAGAPAGDAEPTETG
jgi:hypothetical protein